MSGQLDSILKRIDYLPPFPLTVTRALEQLKSPKITAEQIAETIKFDQAVATNVLRLCNSSYFGLRRSVTRLDEALVYIGLSQLRKILILSGTRQYFEKQLRGYESSPGELWRHSLATAVIAERLASKMGLSEDEPSFIAALLHDIGKLVLSEFLEPEASRILTMVREREISFLAAEREVLSIDHAELGGRILKLWKFSQPVIDAVRDHHRPPAEGDSDLTNIVRLADSVALLMGMETVVDGLAYEGYSVLVLQYGLTQQDIEMVISESLDEIERITADYGIVREGG